MLLFDHSEFSDHEQVCFFRDKASGLKAIVAVHSSALGNALGGCRMWPYASEEEALRDVLRLSKGMTYKCAAAGLDVGGGKSVIIGDPQSAKTPELMRAMGRCIDQLAGRYIAAEDSGINVSDIKHMREQTEFVAGFAERSNEWGRKISGDPSPATALGVFTGMKAALQYRYDKRDLDGVVVSVQGLGNVGYRLVELLVNAGARVKVHDLRKEQVARAVAQFNVKAVSAEEIVCDHADVYAPCAMGATINDDSIDKLKVGVIAGAANNQLQRDELALKLKDRDILYAPDYVINAGGIIDCAYTQQGRLAKEINDKIEHIGTTLMTIFQRAEANGVSTLSLANEIAEQRLARPHCSRLSALPSSAEANALFSH